MQWGLVSSSGDGHAPLSELLQILDDALAEGLLAHQGGAAVLLQGRREDLRRRGRGPIHPHVGGRGQVRQRGVCGEHAVGQRLICLRVALLGDYEDDCLAGLQQQVGGLHSTLQQPAPVVPQVKHQRVHAFERILPVQRLQRRGDLLARAGGEAAHLDVAHLLTPRLQLAVTHALELDGPTQRRHVHLAAAPGNAHARLGALLAAHDGRHLLRAERVCVCAVHVEHPVPPLQTRLLGRGPVLHARDHCAHTHTRTSRAVRHQLHA
mmetsp:Transcript_35509/g.78204  ORF Transcript_35509/g.78204 Transcript_35509/m.78204 type:complete len:265 (+) Transcript_35509:195-989(+)